MTKCPAKRGVGSALKWHQRAGNQRNKKKDKGWHSGFR